MALVKEAGSVLCLYADIVAAVDRISPISCLTLLGLYRWERCQRVGREKKSEVKRTCGERVRYAKGGVDAPDAA